MYQMSFCQPITSTFAVSPVSWTLWHVWLLHIVHVIYFEFLVSVTHAPVLSSSPTTLAIFAHSLIPWHCIPAFFSSESQHLVSVVPFQCDCRDIPEFRAIDRSRFSNPSACSWEPTVSAKKPNSDRRRILDFVKLRAKRCPGRGKCGYVRRVVSRGDRWVQSHQEEEYRIGWIVKQHLQTFLKTRKLTMPPP